MTDFQTQFAPRLSLDTLDLHTGRHYETQWFAVYGGAVRCKSYICNSQVSQIWQWVPLAIHTTHTWIKKKQSEKQVKKIYHMSLNA